jgi:cysteine sulfinate desulfinase/cysteine desulfurase-like protein
MQLNAERTRGSLRFSFGRFNSDGDVDQACASVPEAIKKLRQLSPPPMPERQAALQTLG